MSIEQATVPPEQATIEYIVVEDESDVLDEIFNKLFEQVEKEIM